LLDGGTNTMLINEDLLHLMTEYRKTSETLSLADNHSCSIIGRGNLGIFDNVALVACLTTPLISTKILCYKPFSFIITHIDDKAYIIDRYINPQNGRPCITTASIREDGLYHMDDLPQLIHYDYTSVDRSHDYVTNQMELLGIGTDRTTIASNAKTIHLDKLTPLERAGGSAMHKNASCAVGLDPIAQLHVRLGHASEKVIKWSAQHGIVKGFGFSYDQIKHGKLKF
jgi:hypothetical protein